MSNELSIYALPQATQEEFRKWFTKMCHFPTFLIGKLPPGCMGLFQQSSRMRVAPLAGYNGFKEGIIVYKPLGLVIDANTWHDHEDALRFLSGIHYIILDQMENNPSFEELEMSPVSGGRFTTIQLAFWEQAQGEDGGQKNDSAGSEYFLEYCGYYVSRASFEQQIAIVGEKKFFAMDVADEAFLQGMKIQYI